MHSSRLLLFRKFDVFHTFYVFLCCGITEKVWKKSGFLKSNKGLLCTPDLVCSFFNLISYIFQRESDKYIQLAKLNNFVFLYKLLIFPPSCPDYAACPLNRKGVYWNQTSSPVLSHGAICFSAFQKITFAIFFTLAILGAKGLRRVKPRLAL